MLLIVLLFLAVSYLHVNGAVSNNLIDLTWPFNNLSISWSDNKQFEFTKETVEESDGTWYAFNELALAEHCGTHLDAPYHFSKTGWKVDEIPIFHLITTGIKIDLSEETEKLGYRALLLPKHLMDWERRHGPIPPNSVVLVYFNWSQYYPNRLKYLGGENPTSYKFPGLSPEAAQWIADTKKIVGVGLDAAGVDPGGDMDEMVHKTLAKHQIYALENVKIPHNLPESGFQLFCLPMLLTGGTGAPVRIIASLSQN